MFKVTSRWPHQANIKIEWNLGRRCNYDCTYCPSIIHDNSSPHTDIDLLKSSIDKLVTLGKPIRLSFTGGEPTVHPHFEDLIAYAKEKGISWISVTTNGTRKAEWYDQLPVDQYVFSVHFEYDWMRVVNTIEILGTMNKNIMVNIMAHHKHMKDVLTATGRLDGESIPYAIRRIRWTEGNHDLFDDMRYDIKDLQWIKSKEATIKGNCIIDDEEIIHANDIIKLNRNQYKGWSCNAGIESLMINWDGDVHRATCRVGGSLGNIYHGTFTIPKDSIVCTRDFCTCAADIPLTKYANNSHST